MINKFFPWRIPFSAIHALFIDFAKSCKLFRNSACSISLQIQIKDKAHRFRFCFIDSDALDFRMIAITKTSVKAHQFSSQTFDYGICQFMNGVLALSEGIPAKAENYLLSAESIIIDIMGTDNEYTKSVYKYLYNLYARWHKPELAEKYRTCLISQ